jgi:protein required for attachment to host cells
MKKPVTWCVVADGQRARILARRSDPPGYTTINALESVAAHRKTAELGPDKPGRARESVGGARHAVEPRVDLHRRAESEFGETVASVLNEAAAKHEFDRVIIVALPDTSSAIRNALSTDAASAVSGVIHKDLTKAPDHEMADRLAGLGAASIA